MPLDKLNTQNFAEATLTKAVTAQADTFMVEQTNNLPDVPFRIQLNREIAEVRRKSPTKLMHIRRGLEGTTARAHQAGGKLIATWTDEMLSKVATHTHQTHNKIEQYIDQTAVLEQRDRFLHVRGVNRFG